MSNRASILGIHVDALTMQEAVQRVTSLVEGKEPAMVATANAEMIMRATKDEGLREALHAANLVVPDGAGTVWAANFLGYPMKERVAGYDLSQELMQRGARKGWRFYFFGSAPGVAEKAKQKAESLYTGIQIVGVRDGYFTPSEEPMIVQDIQSKAPDILLVALGVPKQEKWILAHRQMLGVPVAIGVGGTLDVMAGVMKRAPRWMQKAKLEWLFRGMMQPQRAGRLLALPKFVLRVAAEKGGQRRTR